MARLVECRTCGHVINKKAKFCHYCGERGENRLLWGSLFVLVAVAAFVAVIDLVVESVETIGQNIEEVSSELPK